MGPEELDALTLEGLRKVVESQLHAGNLEINVVGDFDSVELEDLLVKYLGTVRPAEAPPQLTDQPAVMRFPSADERRQTWHLKDSDERAVALIAGPPSPFCLQQLKRNTLTKLASDIFGLVFADWFSA